MTHIEKKESLKIVLETELERKTESHVLIIKNFALWFDRYEFDVFETFTVLYLYKGDYVTAKIDLDYISDDELAYLHRYFI